MSEKIRWSPAIWLVALLFNLLLAITIWGVLDTAPTLALTSLSLLGTFILAIRSSYQISVDENVLRVGRAWIDRRFINGVIALDRDQMRRARGYELDPAAHLELRSWLREGVKITLNDPQDPTPYWLISTAKSKELVAALQK